MTSTVYSGAYAGTILVYAISGSLTERWDWHAIFYLFGILGCIWFFLWIVLARSSPWTDKGISIQERSYILGTVPNHKEKLPVPWKALFSKTSVWAIIVMNLCHNWTFYTFLTWLPSYFTKQLGETIVKSSLYSMVAYIAYFVFFNVAGISADYFITSKKIFLGIF
jgi:ACS family sodium-dependent inorganic phosphate cotransporter